MYTGAIRTITADRLNAHSAAILRGLIGHRNRWRKICVLLHAKFL